MPDPVRNISRNAVLAGQPLPTSAASRMQNQQRGIGGADQPAAAPLVHPGSGWFSWLKNPAVLLSTAQAFFTKPRVLTLEQISAAERRYIPSEKIKELSQRDDIIGVTARKIIQAGQEAHDQASKLLKSFLLYKNAYRSDGTSTSDPIVLEVMTNRVFEDILIYLVLNYRKNMLRLQLQALVPEDIGQSQSVYPSLYGKVPLFPWELLDALTEIIKANPEKAKKYLLEVHENAVRENAKLPYIVGTESGNLDETSYFQIMEPAIVLYENILNRRIAAFGADELPVSRNVLGKRLAQSSGSNIKTDAEEALRNISQRIQANSQSAVANSLAINSSKVYEQASEGLSSVAEFAGETGNVLDQRLRSLANAAGAAAQATGLGKRKRSNNFNNNNSQGSPKNARARTGFGPNSQERQVGGKRRNKSRRNSIKKIKSRKNTQRKRR